MQRTIVLSFLLVVSFLLGSCSNPTSTPLPSPTPQPLGTQDIVFISDREGSDDIFLINSDGSSLAQLTDGPGEDRGPMWSYDGRLIAFWSLREDNNDIYTIHPDGSQETRLTTSEYREWAPTWLRDSQHILYTGLSDQLFIMEYDGTFPQVSEMFSQNYGLWNLTESPTKDGLTLTALIYSEEENVTHFDVFWLNGDGSIVVNLSKSTAMDQLPSFSPDGKKIVFFSDRDGNSEIYVVNIDGTGLTNLSNNPAEDSYPSWSPDGKKIVFASTRDGNSEIYVMNSDGTNPVNITNNPANDSMPNWRTD